MLEVVLALESSGVLSSSGVLVSGSLMLLELLELKLLELLELLELLDEEELVLGVSSVVQPPVQPVIPTARTRTAAVSRTANRFIFI